MKQFIKTDYYIQLFLACVLNPLSILTVYGIAMAFPIIGIYQILSDFLHLFVYKTEFLNKERTLHFYGAILYIIVVGLCTYGLILYEVDDSIRFNLFVIFCFIIPEIMIWVRFYWSRKHYWYEKKSVNDESNLINKL